MVEMFDKKISSWSNEARQLEDNGVLIKTDKQETHLTTLSVQIRMSFPFPEQSCFTKVKEAFEHICTPLESQHSLIQRRLARFPMHKIHTQNAIATVKLHLAIGSRTAGATATLYHVHAQLEVRL